MAGHLSVTIIEAKALEDEDTFNGANDAYKQRTGTILNSIWNETFQL
jgi:hypothetical protein